MIIGIFAVFVFWIVIVVRGWRFGLYLLLCYIPFGGIAILMLYPASYPTLLKDVLFVIPTYLIFGWQALSRCYFKLNSYFTTTMGLFGFVVLAQSTNPAVNNWLVAAIGVKIWLFYMPMIFIGYMIASNIKDLIVLIKIMVVIAWIPCLIGIGEFFASSYFGYNNVMVKIYGDAAFAATQNLQVYDFGGLLFRIPSTFSYWVQYSGYTFFTIVPAYMLLKSNVRRMWRNFARASLALFIIASFLSGAKANFIFVPLLILLITLLEGRALQLGIVGVAVTFLLFGVLRLGGIKIDLLFDELNRLFVKYYDQVVIGGLEQAVKKTLWGVGTGMNTGAARYAFVDPTVFHPIENYYAKIVYELGIIGLIVWLGIFLGLIVFGLRQHARIKNNQIRSFSSAILSFMIVMVINSLKGWQIDIDPINVYFWLFSGILLRLKYLQISPERLSNNQVNIQKCPLQFPEP